MLTFESYTCFGCGADMRYEQESGRMVCDYCGQFRDIAVKPLHHGVSLGDYARHPSANLTVISKTSMAVDCEGCGVNLVFEPPNVIHQCPFCSRQSLAAPRSVDPALPPMALLPFKINREQAQLSLLKLNPPPIHTDDEGFNHNIFRSSKPFRKLRKAKLVAIYLPFWVYDGDLVVHYGSKMIGRPHSSRPFIKKLSGQLKFSLEAV